MAGTCLFNLEFFYFLYGAFRRSFFSLPFLFLSLWHQLVVIRADLNGHLKALKDYFLLAKGDFFQVWIIIILGSLVLFVF